MTTAMMKRLPAEWEPCEAIWLAWPHNIDTWPDRFAPIPAFFASWIHLICESSPVRLLADEATERAASKVLGNVLPTNLQIVPIKTNDCWIRDYGPAFVLDPQGKSVQAVDWKYNAWGGKYPPWDDDDAAAAKISQHLNIDRSRSELCLEGGAIETDGNRRLLAFRHCLQCDRRNPLWTENEIANELHRQLGVLEIVWIDGGGLVGDDTDGHIDQLARFVDPQNVVAAVCEDSTDANSVGLRRNYKQLQQWAKQTQPAATIHPLPIPPARSINDTRVPESYCNFLRIGPERMMVPQFGSAQSDARAIGILKDLCPKVDVTGVDCRDLVWGLGALHCASLNQPLCEP